MGVQSADIKQVRKFWRQQIKYGVASVRIGPGGDETRGLVQRNRNRALGVDEFAINLDVVVRTGLGAKIGADLPVDPDAPRGN